MGTPSLFVFVFLFLVLGWDYLFSFGALGLFCFVCFGLGSLILCVFVCVFPLLLKGMQVGGAIFIFGFGMGPPSFLRCVVFPVFWVWGSLHFCVLVSASFPLHAVGRGGGGGPLSFMCFCFRMGLLLSIGAGFVACSLFLLTIVMCSLFAPCVLGLEGSCLLCNVLFLCCGVPSLVFAFSVSGLGMGTPSSP